MRVRAPAPTRDVGPAAAAVCARSLVACAVAFCTHWHGAAIAAPEEALKDCAPDAPCERVDFGTCGNACCGVDFRVPKGTSATADAFKRALSNGGPDGRYTLPPLNGGRPGFTDLRKFPVDADFIGQVVHTTAKRNFHDTINIRIAPDGSKGSLVRAFSISDIGGALGDNGQNFANVDRIAEAVGASADGWQIAVGCGETRDTAEIQ